MRATLTVCMARLFGSCDDGIFSLAAAVEMAHAASLLHDDVLDQALTRRGHTAAHVLFGASRAILAGDALLATANRVVANHDHPGLSRVFSDGIAWTAHGEILEIEHQGQLMPLPVYLEVIEGKTAWMIRMACEVGALYAGATPDAVQRAAEYGHNLGMAFQMVDDALDFAPGTGKPVGGDLREGKYTPPLHAYVNSLPEAERAIFAERFRDRTFDEAECDRVVAIVRERGYDNEARELAESYLAKARNALADLGCAAPNAAQLPVLEGFLGAVRHRQH